MKKIALIFIACSFLLAGCWDERLYKEYYHRTALWS